jgi:hypothetical protein
MRSFSRSAVRARRQVPGDDSRGWVRVLLACGLAASLLYGAMIWVIRFEGYSPLSQTVSELSAWGVSTRPLWTVLGTLWDAMMIAFAVGVLASAGRRGVLRIVGGLLLAYGLLGLAWPLVSMHPRDVLAAGGATLADTGHLVLVGATGVVMVAAMAFGAAAFGRLFRVYSIATIVVLLVCGAMTGAGQVPDRGEPVDALGRALGAHQHRLHPAVGGRAGRRPPAHLAGDTVRSACPARPDPRTASATSGGETATCAH